MAKIKCGIEIHQQLSGKKLFCECPVRTDEGTPDRTTLRRLRAVVGETGEIDIAAAQESMKQRSYLYEGFNASSCLIDLDEEPPRSINQDALMTAIQVGKLFKAKFIDEAQVMRKTVVDGSNTAGFQRTALVAYDGAIETSLGSVTIQTVIVEEDSCRRIRDDRDKTVFRLDRLGIPLLEIATGPDIVSAEHCAEVAEQMGLLLRSTGKVRRGLGTIRQDVNVSIAGGTRVEIKGAQDLKMIPKLVEIEASRQEKLLSIRDELKKRNIKKVECNISDVTSLLKNCDSKIIQKSIKTGAHILGIQLAGFATLVGKEVQPNKRLGTEFSEHAKVMAGVGGIFHSDELPDYGITPNHVEKLMKHFKCGKDDAFILVCADKKKGEIALKAVTARAQEAIKRVPAQVRAANDDGTTRYLRPMPGASRMYPETDVLPARLDKKLIDSVKLPELISDKIVRYEGLGLGKDLAEATAKSDKADLFDACVKKSKKIKDAYIAEIITSADKVIRREFKIEIDPSDDDFFDLFAALEKNKITKESVIAILKENLPVKEVLSKYHLMSDKELKEVVKRIVDKNKGLPLNSLIGQVMAQLRGKAPGQKIVELVKKLA